MKSKYGKAIVYDLETGGLNKSINSITEIAMVAVDLENLEVVEEFSVLFKPYVDLSWITSPIKDAKTIYKNTGERDEETKMKILKFKEQDITLKNLDPLISDITSFYEFLEEEYGRDNLMLSYAEVLKLEQHPIHKAVFKIFFNHCYNPQALEVTKISRELFESQGREMKDAFQGIREMIDRHTHGNTKPIMVGHNIGSLPRRIVKGKEITPDGFDNPFMEKLFWDNGDDFFFCINDDIIDTLKWARLKWTELPGYNLGTCANEVGLTLKEAHRALPDTIANAKFFIKMISHLRGEGSLKSRYKRRKYNFQF